MRFKRIRVGQSTGCFRFSAGLQKKVLSAERRTSALQLNRWRDSLNMSAPPCWLPQGWNPSFTIISVSVRCLPQSTGCQAYSAGSAQIDVLSVDYNGCRRRSAWQRESAIHR